MEEKQYIAIDLKSFYASVECVERHLDPMTVNLVVADLERTEKTICLAVSPALKAYGIPGRPRLFEVVQKVKEINRRRRLQSPNHMLTGKSCHTEELENHPEYALDYIVAKPRMAHYMAYSGDIYSIYLKYIAPEDIHVYSIDEVFIDATSYLKVYKKTARELAMAIILDIIKTTGITATAGIGPNLYLCKIAMDIVAKHIPADENGVRIAELSELSYRQSLWDHRPLTDFWRIGRGYSKKLEAHGMNTMGDVARCSLQNEDLLYRLFGVNAELLIDHAWGYEPCTIKEIKAYKPETNSLCSGQVLREPYTFDSARLVAHEIIDSLSLDLVSKALVTDQLALGVGYDIDNLKNPDIKKHYHGEIKKDAYGREVPKEASSLINLDAPTSSGKKLAAALLTLFDRIVNPVLLIRRMTVTANRVIPESEAKAKKPYDQIDLFTDYAKLEKEQEEEKKELAKEKQMQKTVIGIKNRYGKNAILKGMNLTEGATAVERNGEIGGHKA